MTSYSTMQTAYQLILRELKCPVCMRYMAPPITQCSSGHNICKCCRPRLNHCPTCRGQLLWVRNLSLENMAVAVNYPCVNKMAGCSDSFPISSIKDHEAKCPYRNHKCPYNKISKEDCMWSGPLPEMKNHVREMHNNPGDNVELSGPFKTVLRNVTEISSFRQVMFALNEIFYVIWEIRDNIFYCATFHIGPKENYSKFKYRFCISKKKGESLSVCLTTRSFMDDVEEVLKSGNCVAIHYSSIEKFVKNCVLPFEIHIFSNDSSNFSGDRNESDCVGGDYRGSEDNDSGDNEVADGVENNQ